MPRKNAIPSLRDKSGSATVTLTDSGDHRRRDFYCGIWGTVEARQRYTELIGKWELAGRQWPCASPKGIAVDEVIQQYWRWSQPYYSKGESETIKVAWKVLSAQAGDAAAEAFGPLKLRLVREAMIEKGWDRKYINRQIHRVCAIFKWASGQELLPITIYQALKSIEPLKRGRCKAREPEPVRPVVSEHVAAIRPWVSRQVWAVIGLQKLTGARPGELLLLRGCNINRDDAIWRLELTEHKTEHHGNKRTIYFGPLARAILAPFLLRPDDAYLFSPAEAEAERLAIATQNRKTPLSCGNVASGKPRKVRDHYTTDTYRRAIARACEKADRWGKGGRIIGNDETVIPNWHPHQLRHTAATEIRKRFGLEAAAVVLGHSSALVTDAIYAERDRGKIEDVMRQIG